MGLYFSWAKPRNLPFLTSESLFFYVYLNLAGDKDEHGPLAMYNFQSGIDVISFQQFTIEV